LAEFETITYEERNLVAYITMNRPEVNNSFNMQMQKELYTVWTSLRRNDDVNVAVLTGAGEKAFCAGLDRNEVFPDYVATKGKPGNRGVGSVSSKATKVMFDDPGAKICPKRLGLWKPVIAAVNGMACAGALYLLGECDIVIASENATFFDPHVTYGMVASFESIHILQKLPLGETIRMMLMGAHERMSAQRAFQVGLVSEVVPLPELLEHAQWVAESIASAPAVAIQASLQAIWTAHEVSRKQALDLAHTFVGIGTDFDNIAAGEAMFAGHKRAEWRLR
jgi:enoyl-CoA hydratase/carnithine racemase